MRSGRHWRKPDEIFRESLSARSTTLTAIETPTALMRNFHQRLEQKKTLRGVAQIQPATGLIPRQCGEIKISVLSSQRDPEAALPTSVPVARPHIAAALGEDGHDVAVKCDWALCGLTVRRKRQADQDENNERKMPHISQIESFRKFLKQVGIQG